MQTCVRQVGSAPILVLPIGATFLPLLLSCSAPRPAKVRRRASAASALHARPNGQNHCTKIGAGPTGRGEVWSSLPRGGARAAPFNCRPPTSFAARSGGAGRSQTAQLTPPRRPDAVRRRRPAERRGRPLRRRRRSWGWGHRPHAPARGRPPWTPAICSPQGRPPAILRGIAGVTGQHRVRAPVKPAPAVVGAPLHGLRGLTGGRLGGDCWRPARGRPGVKSATMPGGYGAAAAGASGASSSGTSRGPRVVGGGSARAARTASIRRGSGRPLWSR
jgi:hypothetical protein